MSKDEVWYCENSKGQKIKPYGGVLNNKKMLKNVSWELKRARKYQLLSIIVNIILIIIIAIQATQIYIN